MKRLTCALAAIVAIAVAGCGGGDGAGAKGANDKHVTLRVTVWTPDETQLGMLKKIGAEFAANDPSVDAVKIDSIPFDNYITALTTQLAGGNPPDAGWILENNAPQFVDAGVLADLTPTLRNAPGYDLADIEPGPLALWKRGDAIYGYPFSNSPFAVFYNADLLRSVHAPLPDKLLADGDWTMQSMAADAAKAASKPGSYGLTVANFDYQNWDFLASIWRGFGAQAWSDDGKSCGFTSPQMKAAMQFFHDMIFRDHSVPAPGTTADFFAGKTAMTITQISKAGDLADVDWKWGVVPLPAGPAGAHQVIGQAALSVFAKSPHAKQAADFVAFATNRENSAKLARFFPPPRKSLLNAKTLDDSNPLLDADQLQHVVLDGIATGKVKPSHRNFAKLADAVRAALDPMWKPDADVAGVLAGACRTAQPLLGS